jgi:hypothetical protein
MSFGDENLLDQFANLHRFSTFAEGAGGSSWPIASVSQFGPHPLLVEPDMTAGTG